MNLYEILKVEENASTQEIKEAYIKLKEENLDEENLVKVNEAYETLSYEENRVEYDRELKLAKEIKESINSETTEEEPLNQETVENDQKVPSGNEKATQEEKTEFLKKRNQKVIFMNDQNRIREVKLGPARFYWWELLPFRFFFLNVIVLCFAITRRQFKTYFKVSVTYFLIMFVYIILGLKTLSYLEFNTLAGFLFIAGLSFIIVYKIFVLSRIGNIRQVQWCVKNGYHTTELTEKELELIVSQKTSIFKIWG